MFKTRVKAFWYTKGVFIYFYNQIILSRKKTLSVLRIIKSTDAIQLCTCYRQNRKGKKLIIS